VFHEFNLDTLPRHRLMPFRVTPDYDALVGPEYAIDRLLGFGPKIPTRRFAGALTRHDGPAEDDLFAYRQKLEALVMLIRGSGASPVLLTQQPAFSQGDARGSFSAERYEKNAAHYHAMFWSYTIDGAIATIDDQNEIMREVAAALDVPLVDVVGTIPREDRYYTDATHLAPPGDAIVAAALLETMSEEGFMVSPSLGGGAGGLPGASPREIEQAPPIGEEG
jgi:hypothetical protein